MSNYNFDYTKDTETKGDIAPLADGIYDGTIEKTEMKTPKTGGAPYINCQIRLANNRVLFERIALNSTNPQAKEVAEKKLKNIVVNAIAKTAEKKTSFTSLEDIASYLHGLPVKIKYQYKGKNDKGYDQEQLWYQPVDDAVRSTGTPATAKTKGPSY
jgi:hypothetical protein